MSKDEGIRGLSLDQLRRERHGPVVVAHRGSSGRAPENTIEAIELALKAGATMIECDVRLTRDKEVVAFHDRTLNRTTTGEGRVIDHSLEELRKLDAGSWFHSRFSGERIPTLNEILECLGDRAFLNIEMKADEREPHMNKVLKERVAEIIKSYRAEGRVFLASFNHRLMREMKTEHPRLTTAIIYKAVRDFASRPSRLVSRARADAFVCGRWWLSKRFLKDLRKHQIPVLVYTINSERDVERMLHLNVDGLITNFPDLVIGKLKELGIPSTS